ncbi:hypothetical protein [Streptomyces anthocyanicus]|uniref:hypothetical protein n=1 Tax=Streptomyces anthocyanicus TaxID=68174 RepID=UPI002E30B6EE|nr:hypothetical protein [Streptomyces anthocyanicus]
MFEAIPWRSHVRANDRRGDRTVPDGALESDGPEAALLGVLRIATPWALGAPGTNGESDGVASANSGFRFAVAGVEWMEFRATECRV